MARKPKPPKQVEALTHKEASRKNIPTAELQSAAQRAEEMHPFAPVTYPRQTPLAEGEMRPRDTDLDPQIIWKGATLTLTPAMLKELSETGRVEIGDAQLVWRGKDQQDWSDLVVQAPPLYIQEKIHPKVIIEDLKRQTKERAEQTAEEPDLFADFNGIEPEARTEFYQHDQHWSNRMILGDSLQVMASLAEREGLRGQVQCIYFDPPYGIKFNSNWQVSTRSRDVKDGKLDQITREPEQVKAFRDTWKDGIHSYLTYLRDRLTAMRDLLTDSGSIFVQIGDENVHRVRALMDEVFGEENHIATIIYKTTSGVPLKRAPKRISDSIIAYSKKADGNKFRKLYEVLEGGGGEFETLPLHSAGGGNDTPREFQGKVWGVPNGHWRHTDDGFARLVMSDRIQNTGTVIRSKTLANDFPAKELTSIWMDTGPELHKNYVVQTNQRPIQRCILMATDPGDLVLDPTCGSGTTAYVSEQWGRRWITVDTSRVSLALARARLMGARYPYYLLADSPEGRAKEQEVSGKVQPDIPTRGDIRQGFVYERAPHIMLKTIANNAEIDVIWQNYEDRLAPLRADLTRALPAGWLEDYRAEQNYDVEVPADIQEWEIPREPCLPWPKAAREAFSKIDKQAAAARTNKHLAEVNEVLGRTYTIETLPDAPCDPMSAEAEKLHAEFWKLRIERQKEIDKSIAQKADVEMLYDRPYEDKSRVRVAGPFTVESLSPHRVVPADEEELHDLTDAAEGKRAREEAPLNDFTTMVIENLRTAGVQQAAKDDRISFTTIDGWPGTWIAAEGRYMEGEVERRAGIFIGPEFGTVTRADLTAAAREALDARFDTLITCGFNFEAHTSELSKLGPLPILKAKMNPDLHMSDELKNTGKGNLFVVFGEPDIEWKFDGDGNIVVEVLGVDVFDPKTGEVRASGKDDIAAWFIDTDYNEESFFVRHAYFMGANDPYKALKTSLKAEIDAEAWASLYRDTSRPFARPETGRFAVKVINHFGDEVMKVFGV